MFLSITKWVNPVFPHHEYKSELLFLLFFPRSEDLLQTFSPESCSCARQLCEKQTSRRRNIIHVGGVLGAEKLISPKHMTVTECRGQCTLVICPLQNHLQSDTCTLFTYFGHISHFLTNCRVKNGADLPLVWVTVTQVVLRGKRCPAATESHLSQMTA